MSYRDEDQELEESTNRVMLVGAGVMLAMALVFPLYRFYEPNGRDQARADQLESLAASGEELYNLNCSSCHGLNGEGSIGPALNSQQFLQSASDTQMRLLIGVGVPGSQMSAYSQDHGGPLTSEQIKALVTFIRSWEPDAPDRPDWRDMVSATPSGDSTGTTGGDSGDGGSGDSTDTTDGGDN